jgi:hypothetical protein
MFAVRRHTQDNREEQIAQLTQVAYHAVLERGFRGSFLELELSLWKAIRQAVEQESRRSVER